MFRFSQFSILLSITLLAVFTIAIAQTPQRDSHPRTASISGRVTVGGAPAANALVMVAEVDPQSRAVWPASSNNESRQRAFIKVRTDGDGRYRVTGLTEGAYLIRALSKAYTPPKNSSDFNTFRSVTLDEGEARDNVDIALVRGGVITGRVSDAEGRPLIGGGLQLLSLDENGKTESVGDYQTLRTDDRGVYRIYGLPAGRYILGAGGEGAYNPGNRESPQTFYPDVTDQKQAKIIEVKEGAEVADIDIRLGAGKNTYEATGRVIDAETGQPLPRIYVVCREALGNENRGTRPGRGFETDDEGKFRVVGLSSGRYELDLWNPQGDGEHYGEKTWFEVGDSDVSGLEVKAIRGSTISGMVVIEGASDLSIRAKLSQLSVNVQMARRRESVRDGGDHDFGGLAYAKVGGDGGFRLTGLSPGMAVFMIGSSESAFLIKRIERDGAEIRNAIEIRRGEPVTGVRIVVVQTNGTIRGQVEITGGKLPEGWELNIWATPIETTTSNQGIPAFYTNETGSAVADEKGRFVIERLIPREYELRLAVMERVSQSMTQGVEGIDEITQRVTVKSGVETPVNLTLDLSRKKREDR
jgi:protocatechuate 3,4-dioxygenase beta subunit